MEVSVNLTLIRDSLLDRIANSKAYFKSQQQGEEDMKYEEKRVVAEELLRKSVVLFLQRFHKYIKVEDLEYFEPHTSSYEVNFYIEEIRKQHDINKKKVKVKNRRYEAMQKLIKEGEYFNDTNMRQRMPHLYDKMIGQYLTEEEKREALPQEPNHSFAGFLMSAIEKSHVEHLRQDQKEMEKSQEEEEEEETDSEDKSDEESEMQSDDDENYNGSNPQPICGVRKEQLRHEFTTMMFEKFLSGKDQYDYSSIDDNAELDSVQMCQIDEEEKYFDSEDPS